MHAYEGLRVQVLEAARAALGNQANLQLRGLGIHVTEIDNATRLAGLDRSENHLAMRPSGKEPHRSRSRSSR